MVHSIEEIKLLWKNWQAMSCKPTDMKKYPQDAVIDEDRSVRWNREEVARRNEEYAKEVARLNTRRNIARDDVYNMLYEYIIDEVGNGCTLNKAKLIWDYVYSVAHHSGDSELFATLSEVIDFATSLLEKEK